MSEAATKKGAGRPPGPDSQRRPLEVSAENRVILERAGHPFRQGQTVFSAEQRAILKVANFRRLANARMPKLLLQLRNIARLGNRATYTYTPAEVAKILEAVEAAVAVLRNSFLEQSSTSNAWSL